MLALDITSSVFTHHTHHHHIQFNSIVIDQYLKLKLGPSVRKRDSAIKTHKSARVLIFFSSLSHTISRFLVLLLAHQWMLSINQQITASKRFSIKMKKKKNGWLLFVCFFSSVVMCCICVVLVVLIVCGWFGFGLVDVCCKKKTKQQNKKQNKNNKKKTEDNSLLHCCMGDLTIWNDVFFHEMYRKFMICVQFANTTSTKNSKIKPPNDEETWKNSLHSTSVCH